MKLFFDRGSWINWFDIILYRPTSTCVVARVEQGWGKRYYRYSTLSLSLLFLLLSRNLYPNLTIGWCPNLRSNQNATMTGGYGCDDDVTVISIIVPDAVSVHSRVGNRYCCWRSRIRIYACPCWRVISCGISVIPSPMISISIRGGAIIINRVNSTPIIIIIYCNNSWYVNKTCL
jgi:hypothetical protein